MTEALLLLKVGGNPSRRNRAGKKMPLVTRTQAVGRVLRGHFSKTQWGDGPQNLKTLKWPGIHKRDFIAACATTGLLVQDDRKDPAERIPRILSLLTHVHESTVMTPTRPDTRSCSNPDVGPDSVHAVTQMKKFEKFLIQNARTFSDRHRKLVQRIFKQLVGDCMLVAKLEC